MWEGIFCSQNLEKVLPELSYQLPGTFYFTSTYLVLPLHVPCNNRYGTQIPGTWFSGQGPGMVAYQYRVWCRNYSLVRLSALQRKQVRETTD